MMKLPLNVDFTGKVVVVTGAGGVLCGEMARAYAQAGAKVAALDLNEEAVKKLADELTAEGFICKGYKANVLDAEALEAVHQQVLADLGPCDILINGAGGNNPRATTDNEYQHEAKEGQKTFFDLEPNGVDFVFKLNFQGTLLPTQAFAKDMVARKSGNILNISSMNAYIPLTKIPAYSGAKAAISNFTQWLATHFAGTGIRAKAVAPRNCPRLPRQQPEPRTALQRGWHAHRAQCENPERHAHGPLCGQQGTPWRRVLPHR